MLASFNSLDSVAPDEHVLVNASLAAATDLFPAYLAGAIRRIPHPSSKNVLVAAISITFPAAAFTSKIRCQMALMVTDNKVQRIAKELFGAELEINAGLRYVCLSASTKVLPNPLLTLQGCRLDVISTIFGEETACAITASPLYQEDIRQGHDYTDCVSMVISHQAADGATLYVSLGLMRGNEIRDKLYG